MTRRTIFPAPRPFSSPRVWWTLRVFGAQKVFILEGGLPRWKAEGRPLESGAVKRAPRTFLPLFREQ